MYKPFSIIQLRSSSIVYIYFILYFVFFFFVECFLSTGQHRVLLCRTGKFEPGIVNVPLTAEQMHKTTSLWHMKEKYAAMQGFTSDEEFSVKLLLKFATTDEILEQTTKTENRNKLPLIFRERLQEFLKYKNFVCQEDIIGGRFFYTKQKTTNEFAASDFSSYVSYLTINKFNV